jgi:membrane protein implicated in regulation of membrane protease activity
LASVFGLAGGACRFHINGSTTEAELARIRQFQVGNLGWRGWIGLIVGAAFAIAAAAALIILSLGLALVLIPIVGVAALFARWRLRKMMAEAEKAGSRPGAGQTIEIEYAVVDEDRDRR